MRNYKFIHDLHYLKQTPFYNFTSYYKVTITLSKTTFIYFESNQYEIVF